MSRKLFNLPLGASPHPLAFKCDPLAAAMIGSSIVGGVANLISGSSSNSANASMNRETRDWQSKENALNRNWQEEMWNKQNVYNTPSAQRSRLEEAGYNPFMDPSVGVGQSSNAGAAGSPSMVGSPNAIPNQPVNVGGPLASIGANILQAKSIDSQVANQSAQTMMQILENAQKMRKMGYDSKEIDDYIKQASSFVKGISSGIDQEVESLRLDNLKKSAENDLMTFQYQMELNWREKFNQADYNNLVAKLNNTLADTAKLYSEKALNTSKIAEIGANIKKLISESVKNGAETETMNALRPYLVSKLSYEAATLRQNYLNKGAMSDFYQSDFGYYWQWAEKIVDDFTTQALKPLGAAQKTADILYKVP